MSHETLSSSADTFSISTADVHQEDASQFLSQEERDPFAEMLEKGNAPDARMQRLHSSVEQAATIVENLFQQHHSQNSSAALGVAHLRRFFTNVKLMEDDRDLRSVKGCLDELVLSDASIPQAARIAAIHDISQLDGFGSVSGILNKAMKQQPDKASFIEDVSSRDPQRAVRLGVEHARETQREKERKAILANMAPAASIPEGLKAPGVVVPPRMKTDSIGA